MTTPPPTDSDDATNTGGHDATFRDLDELIGCARVMFWMCPIAEHSKRKGQVIVEWIGDVAHCTADGCDLTSATPTPTEGATP